MFESTVTPLLRARSASLEKLHNVLEEMGKNLSLEYGGELDRLNARLKDQLRTSSEKYTICVVGEFKVGKSTFLNGLLGLSGEAALSSADVLDTACSVMIRQRGPDDPEALLVFDEKSKLPTRPVTWREAKRLTSQFYRNMHREAAREAESLVRVEYFLTHPLLENFHLNDLPGVGSLYWKWHTAIAEQSLRTADTIVWLVFDEEPARTATQFLDIVAQESRRVIPVVNVRQEPPDPPESQVADAIADQMTRLYRHHFTGVSRPLMYSARVVELEMTKAAHDASILESAGYNALIELLFLSDAADERARIRERRVCGACRGLFTEAAAHLAEQLAAVTDLRKKSESSCREFADRLRSLDPIHQDIETQILSVADVYADRVCDAVVSSAELFIDDKLRITNWETVKAIFADVDELTKKWGEEFERDHMAKNPHLDSLQRNANHSARTILRTLWQTADETIDCDSQNGAAPSRELNALYGEDLDEGVGRGIWQALGGAALLAMIFVFPPFMFISDWFAKQVTRNPMEKMRQEALRRTSRTVRNAGFALRERFVSAWMRSSENMQKTIRERLGGRESVAQQQLGMLQQLSQQLAGEQHGFQQAADWLYQIQKDGRFHI
jgi:hypothetical protein